MMMHKNRSVDVHQFAMVPRADIPRSAFKMQHTHKTTFDAGKLIPIYVDEVLPGDTFQLKMTAFARLATPIYPIMDNLHLDSFFFFVPNRLIWNNWQKFMGEQDNPTDSIDYEIPTMTSPAGGYEIGSLQDYMGLPTAGQMTAPNTFTHSALHTRAYNLIWNTWFRDQNLQDSVVVDKDDGPDTYSDYVLLRRGKRHDYFTSALPSPQKGATAVSLPLGTTAPVIGDGTTAMGFLTGTGADFNMRGTNGSADLTMSSGAWGGATFDSRLSTDPAKSGLVADLASATAATINQIRQAFQIQRLLERDARGGTRYTEIILSHFGVRSPDARLQRPEYLGGGSTPIIINPVAQTSGTSASGTTTPLGNLAAVGTGLSSGHGFTQSFTEHGVIIGMVSVRADLTYQQGVLSALLA